MATVGGEGTHGPYRYRWVVLGAFMLVAALTQLMWLSYAPITSQTQRLMHASEFQVVLLATMFPLLYIPVSIPAGLLIDRWGFRFAVLLSALLTAGCSFLRLFADSYPLVLCGMIGIAVGQPFVLNSITKLVATWFPTGESALATGLATLSLFVGMMVALAVTPPLLAAFGAERLASLRSVVLVYSLAALGGLLLFALLARARPPTPPQRTERELQDEGTAITRRSLRAIFALRNFLLLCVILFIGNGAFVGVLQLLEKILLPKGIATGTAGNIGAVMVLAGVVGCIVIPALSDKVARRKPFLVLAAASAVPTLFLLGTLGDVTALFVVGAVSGFFLLSAYPLVLTFAEETTGHALTGTASSILLLLGNAGGVALTFAMEALKEATGAASGSFFWSMVFLVALFAVAVPVAAMLREPRAPEPAAR
jgi:nitrate/nitrite transporter NarK